MSTELRKVKFSLNSATGFSPDDLGQREMDEMARSRNGLFHGSTEIVENDVKKLRFIVEDENTGEIFQIDPLLVKFKIEDNENS